MAHTDETKEEFYEELDKLLQAVPCSDKLVLLGDFNARRGCDYSAWEKVLGCHGIGKVNSNRILLLTTCTQCQLTITNTFFQQHGARKMTWMNPCSGHWHQINFAIVQQWDISDVHHTRSMLGSTCFSDHCLLRITIAFSFKTPRRVRPAASTKKFNVWKLSSTDVAAKVAQKSETALNNVRTQGLSLEDHWSTLRDVLHSSAEETIGFVKQKHCDWLDENDPSFRDLLSRLHHAHIQYMMDKLCQSKKTPYLCLKREA